MFYSLNMPFYAFLVPIKAIRITNYTSLLNAEIKEEIIFKTHSRCVKQETSFVWISGVTLHVSLSFHWTSSRLQIISSQT